MKIKLRHVDVESGVEHFGILEVVADVELRKKLKTMAVYSLSERDSDGCVIGGSNILVDTITLQNIREDVVYRPNSNNVFRTQKALRTL